MKIQIPPVGMRHGLLPALRAIFRLKTLEEKRISFEISNLENQWYFFNTGKSALLFILKILKHKTDDKNEVIIPAYTCYSVAAAIAESGLEIKICDIEPKTLEYNYQQLESLICDKTLCVIETRLFGVRADYSQLKNLLQNRDVYIIEDAAQCEPESVNGESDQDLTIYSLGRGKPLSAMGGGIVVSSNTLLNKLISKKYKLLPKYSYLYEIKKFVEVIINDMFLKPYLFWIPYSIKHLNLGKTVYPVDIEIKKLTKFQNYLFYHQVGRLQFFSNSRNKIVKYYKKILPEKYIERFAKADVVPVRFPIYLKRDITELSDEEMLELMRLGVTRMYPSSINHLKEIKGCFINQDMEFKGAEWVVRHLLTLPTHEYINNNIQQKIVSTIVKVDSK